MANDTDTAPVELASTEKIFQLAIALVAIIISTLIAREVQSWRRLRHVPGPFWSSLTNLPMAKLAGTGRISFELNEIQKKYGPLMRIGPDVVMFGDADTYRLINGARSEFTKGEWYRASKITPNDSIFTMTNDADRKELKAKLTPGYSRRNVFEQGIDRVLSAFIDLIEQKYITTPTEFRPLDLAHKAMYLAIDTITELSWGEQMGFIANDADMYKYLEINDGFFPVLAVLLTMPRFSKLLSMWPLKLALPKEGDAFGFGRIMSLVNQSVDKHLGPDAEQRNSILESHVRHGLSRDELIPESLLELIAGSDSTATAIRTTILCLISTPSALQKLRDEIDNGIRSGRISSPITDAEAQELPYLQAVIKENIRIYPPSTGWNGRAVPKGGVHIHGYYLPAGTQVALNTVHLMRKKETFGPDADIFYPERWLGDGERLKEMNSVIELAFGHGKFTCLGKVIALMELNKIFVELLRRYDISLATPHAPMQLFDAAFWMVNDYDVVVRRRAS